MARVKLTKEFKEAISYISSNEKDKLLNRLLAKEPLLVEQLTFKLLEDSSTIEPRREILENAIKERLNHDDFYTPGYLLKEIRDLSAKITFHVRAVKDQFGEISLNILLLSEALSNNNEDLNDFSLKKTKSFNKYVLLRCLKLMELIEKIHDDYRLEFQDDLKALAYLIGDNPNLMDAAIFIGFDVNWFINGETYHDTKPHKAHAKYL